MKFVKKLTALFLAVCMVMAMGITAFAKDPVVTTGNKNSSYTITVNDASDKHTFEAYQVFVGDLKTTTRFASDEDTVGTKVSVLSNVEWGSGVDGDKIIAALKSAYSSVFPATVDGVAKTYTAADVANWLAENNKDDGDVAKAFATIVGNNLRTGNSGHSTSEAASAVYKTEEGHTSEVDHYAYTIGVTGAGYYFIKDKDSSLNGDDDSYTRYILQVVEDVSVNSKSDVPTLEKKVDDKNDSKSDADVNGKYQDSADYDIGDTVPFTLKATVASNMTSYKGKYYFAFHDQLESGKFDNFAVGDKLSDGTKVETDDSAVSKQYANVKVYLGSVNSSNEIESSNYILQEGSESPEKCTFEVVFNDLKGVKSKSGSEVTNSSVIIVTFDAKLGTGANIGSKGNTNKAKLEYSNNPNATQEGDEEPETGKTPWDNVIVFTYKLVVSKVDQDGAARAGAAFDILKKNATTNTYEHYAYFNVKTTANKKDSTKGAGVDKTGTPVDENGQAATNLSEFTNWQIYDNEATSWTLNGLDDGDYKLVEVIVPGGYNKADDIEFSVVANHVTDFGSDIVTNSGNEAVYGQSNTAVLSSLSGYKTDGTVSITSSEGASATVENKVVNKPGSTLPSTGGMGTTVIYIAGIALIVAAGVVVIARKRMA